MLTKEKILATTQAMPEEKFEDIDILLERLVFLQKLEKAEEDIAADRVYSHDKAKTVIDSWFPSTGQHQQ